MILSCDDACGEDIRVAELADKNNIEAIFYWPVEYHGLAKLARYEPLSWHAAGIIADNFEIGSHGITHGHLTRMPLGEAKYEIETSKYMLENLFGIKIRKFAPSRGYTTPALTKHTLKFYESQRLTKQRGLVHVHPNSGANNNKPWRQCVTENTKEIWCHSWELTKYGLWEELDDFLSQLK